MNAALQEGLTFEFTYTVPVDKTVPHIFAESEEFRIMPQVLATGFMVGLFEWACIRAIKSYMDYPREQTVGTHVNFSHVAPTPPGLAVTVKGRLDRMEGRRLCFSLEAHDDSEKISEGTHERFIINTDNFNRKAAEKRSRILG